jgi:hypothetical protein
VIIAASQSLLITKEVSTSSSLTLPQMADFARDELMVFANQK